MKYGPRHAALALILLLLSSCVTFQTNKDPAYAGHLAKVFVVVDVPTVTIRLAAFSSVPFGKFLSEAIPGAFLKVGVDAQAMWVTGLELSAPDPVAAAKSAGASALLRINSAGTAVSSSPITTPNAMPVVYYYQPPVSQSPAPVTDHFDITILDLPSNSVVWRARAEMDERGDTRDADRLADGLVSALRKDGLIK